MPIQLATLPATRPTRIVVGTSVRKSAAVLRFYLDALARQTFPPDANIRITPVFVADNMEKDAELLLRDWTAEHGGEVLAGVPAPSDDFTDRHPDTHQWSASAMARVGAAKDRILERARALDADYVWFCDADLICDPTTLRSMLSVGAPIVTAVYWTRWSALGTETRRVHAAPQVWLRHPYVLSGNGLAEHEFRDRLARRQLVPVAGYGACTLLSRRALEAGISFAPVPDVAQEGLMAGEDRQFCIRARRLHIEAVADAWPDIYHIYHLPADLTRASEYAERLNAPHPTRATLGALVSLTLQAIEPIPWSGGGFTAVPPQHMRGRLGQLALVPEIEEAIYDLSVGESRIIPVHFPVHYEIPMYQGQRRLIRVTLHDTKPLRWAPVLEKEILAGINSGASLRTVDYTTKQLEGMRDGASL